MAVVIVGAGLAGLTLARQLCARGIKPVLIEREKTAGGLARSFTYDNGTTFDIGPHRFHTDNAEVRAFIEEMLGVDVLEIRRKSQLFLFGRYLPWPMTVSNILALPFPLLFRTALDLFLRKRARTESFEDYILEKYGPTLYRVFFKPYTEKFLDYTCRNLHRDWASTGINRATIDGRIDTTSLTAFAMTLLKREKTDTTFLYPGSGGIGVLAERLRADIEAGGGRFLFNTEAAEFVSRKGRINAVVTQSGETIDADHVFWSGSLGDLRRAGRAPELVPRMYYISTVLFNYLVAEHAQQEFQWCYYGGQNMAVSRISLPRMFNAALVPEGREGLCVEMSCSENSETWRDPSRLDCVVETFLLHSRLVSSLDHIEEYHLEHIRNTYPLYTLNYRGKLSRFCEWVDSSWKNFTLIGRTGRFWYNNMDHSIAASLISARRFADDYNSGVLRPGNEYGCEDRYLTGKTS